MHMTTCLALLVNFRMKSTHHRLGYVSTKYLHDVFALRFGIGLECVDEPIIGLLAHQLLRIAFCHLAQNHKYRARYDFKIQDTYQTI